MHATLEGPRAAEAGVIPERNSTVTRSVAVDLARVLGVVAIVAGHTWGAQAWTHTWLYAWHVPLFFIVTGYLWKPNRSTWVEARRRAATLLIPYLTWLVLITVVWLGFRVYRGEPLDYEMLRRIALGGWYIGGPYAAAWFMTALFFATVLTRWLTNISPFLPWFVGGVGVAWSIMDPISLREIPEAAGLALPAIFFVCVGMLLRQFRDKIDKPMTFGLVLLLPALFLGGFGVIAPPDMKGGLLGTPVLGVLMSGAISCGLILTLEAGERFLPVWTRRPINIVAQAAIPIILGHALVLGVSQLLGFAPSKWVFLTAYLLPLAFAFLVMRTPLKRFLL